MKSGIVSVAAVMAVLFVAGSARAEVYGNFTTMGIVTDCPEGQSPETLGPVKAYLVTGDKRQPIHDLVRVGAKNYYAGSIFHLKSDTEYTVEVELRSTDSVLVWKTSEKGRTRREPVVPETTAALYVSPSGNDENPGTIDRPLKSVAAGFGKLTRGTTLFLREGVYYEGDLKVSVAAGERPVVIRGYKGERAVIDGADPALVNAAWEAGEKGIYAAPFNGSTWNVTLEERKGGKYYRLYAVRTMEELTSRMSAGLTFERLGFTGAYYCDGKKIHILPPKGDIADYRPHVSRHTMAFTIDGTDGVSVEGLEVRHFGSGHHGRGIFVLDSSEVIFEKCGVYYSNAGIWLKGKCNNVTIQDSKFVDDAAHWDFEYVKTEAGWNFYDQIETGAVFTDADYSEKATSEGDFSGRGLVFRRNEIVDYFDGAHLSPWPTSNVRTLEIDFCENRMSNCADDLMECDGWSRNIRIFDNYMVGSLSGVSLAQGLDGPTWIVNNVIANSGVCYAANPGRYPGYPWKTNGGPGSREGSGPAFFYHNTSYTQDPKSDALLVKRARWKKFTLKNNIWCGKVGGLRTSTWPISPMDWDYDNVFTETGLFARYDRGRIAFPTIEDFRKETGWLAHGISKDPRFVDADRGDYRLQPGSPCIDAGVVINGINDGRFSGKAPDLGAFEVGTEAPVGR